MANLKIDDKALQLISDFYEIGGGAQVVTELPEVGEEYTIYELQEKKVLTSLVAMNNQQMNDDGIQFGNASRTFVFETTKEMQDTFNSITIEGEYSGDIYLNYITNEDKLIGAVYVKGAWRFTEATKVSSCKFDISEIYEYEEPEYVVILKEYLGIPEVEEEAWYTGRLWNDELYTFEKMVSGIVLGTPTVGVMDFGECMDDLPEIPPFAPSEVIFEYIPYEKIINYQLVDEGPWIFTPKSEEVTVTSYWIYTSNEWVNIDEIPDPNLIKIGVICSNGSWNTPALPLNTITVTYDDVDYEITKYAEVTTPSEQAYEPTTYYGYIEVPMPTQDNLVHTISVSTSARDYNNWFFDILSDVGNRLNQDSATIDGISLINIYYQILN